MDPSKHLIEEAAVSRLRAINAEISRLSDSKSFNKFKSSVDEGAVAVQKNMIFINNLMEHLINEVEDNIRRLDADCVDKCASERCKFFHQYLSREKALKTRCAKSM